MADRAGAGVHGSDPDDASAYRFLAAGSRLPSTRSLAGQLSLARGTVDTAYAMLAGDGYVLGRGAAGTVVAALDHRAPAVPAPAAGGAEAADPAKPGRFQLGLPALDAVPRKLWARLAARHARALGPEALLPPDACGLTALRAEIAVYLRLARGIVCAPEQVLVTAGFQGALGLVVAAFARPGDTAWVEDPGYFRARQALELAGLAPVAVPVDADGLDVAYGRRRAAGARLAVVTPTHQFPLGSTLALPRRLDLLAWAREAGAYVVEDDYDSEYQYRGPPPPALKSLDGADRVLYAGSFSKVLFPGLRLGYLVVPAPLVDRCAAVCRSLMPGRSILDQAVLADFLREGHFSRHVGRMRRLYAERRDALAAAFEAVLSPAARLVGPLRGMHLVLELPAAADEAAILARARAAGMALTPLAACAVAGRQPPGLVIGFTNIPADEAAHHAALLGRVIRP